MTHDDAIATMVAAFAQASGLPTRTLDDVPNALRRSALQTESRAPATPFVLDRDGGHYLGQRYHWAINAVVLLGPFRRDGDPISDMTTLDETGEHRLREGLSTLAVALGQVLDEQRRRLEVASQLELVSGAAVAITAELSLDTVLRRLVDLTRELAGARYAALGIPGPDGTLSAFITSGLTPEEEARIGPYPTGHGILGLLLRERRTIRLADLHAHPASVGFPPNHPPMRSFLGVPIIARGRILGNLYLTEKRSAPEFSDDDAQLVEMLAKHAAVAIENATLYQHIQQQQQRLQVMIDQLPEAVVVVEPDPDRVTLANGQTSTLLGRDIHPPLLLTSFFDGCIRENDRSFDSLPIGDTLRSGIVVTRREVQYTRPDGTRMTVLVNLGPLRDADGTITAAMVVFQDITQIKDAEQLKDDFLSLVSHELRTPITTIQGDSYLLTHDGAALDAATQQAMLNDIWNESQRLGSIVENMVQLANIRAGRLALEVEPVHMRVLLERAVTALKHASSECRFTIRSDDHVIGLGDPGSLDQVLRNLLENAVKYSPADLPIELEAVHRDGRVIVSVRDHGPGISAEDTPVVFERFRRGHHADERPVPGMGLGLYLSKHLVEAHGGEIWIERPPDGGTRMCFSIPAPTAS